MHLSSIYHIPIIQRPGTPEWSKHKRDMFWAWAIDKPNVAVVMTVRVSVNNPEVKQENIKLVFCFHGYSRGCDKFSEPSRLLSITREWHYPHTFRVSHTHHLMVIGISLPTPYPTVHCPLVLELHTRMPSSSSGFYFWLCIRTQY